MSPSKALRELKKLKNENRDNHAQTILTSATATLDEIRYSQGYINALDWVDQTLAALMKETEEEDDE